MTSMIKDETNKIYGDWKVLVYIGKSENTNGSLWQCECIHCKGQTTIRGANLRRNKLPKCKNCCLKCRKTRQQVQIKTGLICVLCRAESIKQWRENNIDHAHKWYATWSKSNRDKILNKRKRCLAKYQSSYKLFLANMLRQKVNYYNSITKQKARRSRQKLNNLHRYKVSVSTKELIELWENQNGKCNITKLDMSIKYNDINSVSIDRIDQNCGYTIENIQLVCRWVNFAKNTFKDDEIRMVLHDFKAL